MVWAACACELGHAHVPLVLGGFSKVDAKSCIFCPRNQKKTVFEPSQPCLGTHCVKSSIFFPKTLVWGCYTYRVEGGMAASRAWSEPVPSRSQAGPKSVLASGERSGSGRIRARNGAPARAPPSLKWSSKSNSSEVEMELQIEFL